MKEKRKYEGSRGKREDRECEGTVEKREKE